MLLRREGFTVNRKRIPRLYREAGGQVDKAGAPYILHPLRMMLAVDR